MNIEKLLGRKEVSVNERKIKKWLRNKKVLITGAAGSIGEALLTYIKKVNKPFCLDHDEYRLFNLPVPDENKFICDIKDRQSLEVIVDKIRPDVIFHTAAFKHVPLMESQVPQAINNNILGTLNVAELAKKYKVKSLINISTDKAVNPISTMGVTKKMNEHIIRHYGYTSVRFGNVLNSRGSLLETWDNQVKHGEELTITDVNCTRYFMTINEAVSLILTAGSLKKPAIYVLKMGSPLNISALFNLYSDLKGSYYVSCFCGLTKEITGLRLGEKIEEKLWEDWEKPKEVCEGIWRIDYGK